MSDYNVIVIKKDGTNEQFNPMKIINAVEKSAYRALSPLTDDDKDRILRYVKDYILNYDRSEITVPQMHNLVESALETVKPEVAKSYRDYRNYKTDFVEMINSVYKKAQSIMYIGDKENSNTDSALVSTKRSLIYNQLNKELYQKFFMTTEELQACRDGYIYIHDMSSRRDSMNCCIFNIANVLNGGFEMGNIWYNEPKTLDTAFDVIGDVTLAAASQQYGGFTLPRIDEVLSKYAELSYNKYIKEETENYKKLTGEDEVSINVASKIEIIAMDKVERDMEQGFQGWEYKFNTVSSSRGDYPFTTITIGLGTDKFSKLASKICLKVRGNGQGAEGKKKAVLFPKIVFTYTEELHGPGKVNEDLFEAGIDCSSKAMYPDWLSLDGDTSLSEMYHKYGELIAPMGCVKCDEIVTYKFNDKLFVESIGRMWNRLSNIFEVKLQKKGEPHEFMKLKNVSIYDSVNGFVDTKAMVKNVSINWMNITLSNGRVLTCTTDHPLPTSRGRIKAKDLWMGDEIPIVNTQYSEETIDIDPDLAWLYGVFICDGCYDKHINVCIAMTYEDEIANKLKLVAKKYYDSDMRIIERHRGKRGNYKELKFNKYSLMHNDFINKFGGLQKKHRHIPNEVFSYNRKAKLAFLGGMIDADGYIDGAGSGISQIMLGSTNKELALQQLALIQSLGIKAKVYKNHYTKRHPEKIRYNVQCDVFEEVLPYIECLKKINNISTMNRTKDINTDYGKVIDISYIDNVDFSYDVTTESDHFDVSGIYSHNCRAFLSPYWEKGGQVKDGDDDHPVFTGRWNAGAISLHLPMILAKARHECKDFYEVLDYYLELIRGVHKRTKDYLSKMRASINPLAFCEGGFYKGNLGIHDEIKPLLDYVTFSFGITALNELNVLYNGKSIREDGEFPLEVMIYINNKLQEFKKEDHILYAIYGTPAESLCETQVHQFRKIYGIVEGVSDRLYVSNSFHCHVTEEMDPDEKQDKEFRFWNLFGGGRIQYVKYPINYNRDAIVSLVRRAMKMGLYEGVNLSLAYCNNCGYEELSMDVCPKCGSKDLTKIERMNGYLSYSRVHGDTRLNAGKMAEIADRKSM